MLTSSSGSPLATEEEQAERIGPGRGIPVFGLDALSSAAYGPEAALTVLIPLGMAGLHYIWPISLSIILLLGIVYFSYRQTISAYPQGGGSYTVASENLGVWPGFLAAAALMIDSRAFYWTSIISILIVLSLSANTAFADFPRLARAIARNEFLPHALTLRGRRLVFTPGVYALAILTGILLTIFRGITDRLIPLYAVGAFLAFTLSQAGMVMHWKRTGGRGSGKSMAINAIGAIATGITVGVVLIAKFTDGAWITVLLIPALMLMMYSVQHHYQRVERATALDRPVNTQDLCPPIAIIPIGGWSTVSEKTLRFAWSISKQIIFVHVECDDDDKEFRQRWHDLVELPAKNANLPVPELVILESPFRFVVRPLVEYALKVQEENSDCHIAILVPELIENHWYNFLLHNNRSQLLKTLLNSKENPRITVINIPWYLDPANKHS